MEHLCLFDRENEVVLFSLKQLKVKLKRNNIGLHRPVYLTGEYDHLYGRDITKTLVIQDMIITFT